MVWQCAENRCPSSNSNPITVPATSEALFSDEFYRSKKTRAVSLCCSKYCQKKELYKLKYPSKDSYRYKLISDHPVWKKISEFSPPISLINKNQFLPLKSPRTKPWRQNKKICDEFPSRVAYRVISSEKNTTPSNEHFKYYQLYKMNEPLSRTEIAIPDLNVLKPCDDLNPAEALMQLNFEDVFPQKIVHERSRSIHTKHSVNSRSTCKQLYNTSEEIHIASNNVHQTENSAYVSHTKTYTTSVKSLDKKKWAISSHTLAVLTPESKMPDTSSNISINPASDISNPNSPSSLNKKSSESAVCVHSPVQSSCRFKKSQTLKEQEHKSQLKFNHKKLNHNLEISNSFKLGQQAEIIKQHEINSCEQRGIRGIIGSSHDEINSEPIPMHMRSSSNAVHTFIEDESLTTVPEYDSPQQKNASISQKTSSNSSSIATSKSSSKPTIVSINSATESEINKHRDLYKLKFSSNDISTMSPNDNNNNNNKNLDNNDSIIDTNNNCNAYVKEESSNKISVTNKKFFSFSNYPDITKVEENFAKEVFPKKQNRSMTTPSAYYKDYGKG